MQHQPLWSVLLGPCPIPDAVYITHISSCYTSSMVCPLGSNVCNTYLCVCHACAMFQWMWNLHNTNINLLCFLSGMCTGVQCTEHILLWSVMLEPCPNAGEGCTTQISSCCGSSVVYSLGCNVFNANFSGLSCLCHVPINVQFTQYTHVLPGFPLQHADQTATYTTSTWVVCDAGAISQSRGNLHNTNIFLLCFLYGIFMGVQDMQHQLEWVVMHGWHNNLGVVYITPTSCVCHVCSMPHSDAVYTIQPSASCVSSVVWSLKPKFHNTNSLYPGCSQWPSLQSTRYTTPNCIGSDAWMTSQWRCDVHNTNISVLSCAVCVLIKHPHAIEKTLSSASFVSLWHAHRAVIDTIPTPVCSEAWMTYPSTCILYNTNIWFLCFLGDMLTAV